jgi:hypothetical protein
MATASRIGLGKDIWTVEYDKIDSILRVKLPL